MLNKEKNPWKTLQSSVKYENDWIKVTEHQTVNIAQQQGIYGTVHFKNIAIGIIPFDNDYNIWLVGQYRYPLSEYSWEICEGGGALNTAPLLSAQRELMEELGIEAQNWKQLLKMHLSNSVSDEYGVVYIAKDLSFHPPEPEDGEVLQIKKIAFNDAYLMVMDGKITDSLSVAGILKAKIMDKGEI